jgi:hypothetical protein
MPMGGAAMGCAVTGGGAVAGDASTELYGLLPTALAASVVDVSVAVEGGSDCGCAAAGG